MGDNDDKKLVATGEYPNEIERVLEEVNERFDGVDDRRAVGDWLNRVTDAVWSVATSTRVAAAGAKLMLPTDKNGKPCMPGDMLMFDDGDVVEILAVDAKNVYYNVEGGSIPTSVSRARSLRHVPMFSDALEWFEGAMASAEGDDERDEARRLFGEIVSAMPKESFR